MGMFSLSSVIQGSVRQLSTEGSLLQCHSEPPHNLNAGKSGLGYSTLGYSERAWAERALIPD